MHLLHVYSFTFQVLYSNNFAQESMFGAGYEHLRKGGQSDY